MGRGSLGGSRGGRGLVDHDPIVRVTPNSIVPVAVFENRRGIVPRFTLGVQDREPVPRSRIETAEVQSEEVASLPVQVLAIHVEGQAFRAIGVSSSGRCWGDQLGCRASLESSRQRFTHGTQPFLSDT